MPQELEEVSIDELLQIIDANANDTEEFSEAFEELRIRVWIASNGGDRPTVPPRNP